MSWAREKHMFLGTKPPTASVTVLEVSGAVKGSLDLYRNRLNHEHSCRTTELPLRLSCPQDLPGIRGCQKFLLRYNHFFKKHKIQVHKCVWSCSVSKFQAKYKQSPHSVWRQSLSYEEEGGEEDMRVPEYLKWKKGAQGGKTKAEEGKSLSKTSQLSLGADRGHVCPQTQAQKRAITPGIGKQFSSGLWWVRSGFALE